MALYWPLQTAPPTPTTAHTYKKPIQTGQPETLSSLLCPDQAESTCLSALSAISHPLPDRFLFRSQAPSSQASGSVKLCSTCLGSEAALTHCPMTSYSSVCPATTLSNLGRATNCSEHGTRHTEAPTSYLKEQTSARGLISHTIAYLNLEVPGSLCHPGRRRELEAGKTDISAWDFTPS